MKVADVNLLLYAVDEDAVNHAAARSWLDDVLSGTETVGFAWVVLLAFIRLTTSPRVARQPLAPAEACDMVAEWLAQPPAALIHPTPRHLATLRGLVETSGTAGNLTTDAHLAALALEHGAELCSADTDFARFPGLRWTNPIAS